MLNLVSNNTTKYDYLIVGAGIFGSVCAYELTKLGKKCLVIDKRDVIGGNCYTENSNGIHIHKYGAHIFHTNDSKIWNFINRFAEFRNYTHNVIANFDEKMYTLPFNMWTFNQLWGVTKPQEAIDIIERQKFHGRPTNLKEQAISMVGEDIFEILIRGYTEKQWNKKCEDLPVSIIKRLPVRFNWDSNYFNDKFTGLPIGGYTQIFEKLLEGIDVELNVDYFEHREILDSISHKIIYTGPIDRFFNYIFGRLEYRSLRWENEYLETPNYQGNCVINFTDIKTPFTRILEHKWFDNQNQKGTWISKEFPETYDGSNEPYYPIRDDKNTFIFEKYNKMTESQDKVYFGGRLANYVYYDMHQIIAQAWKLVEKITATNPGLKYSN